MKVNARLESVSGGTETPFVEMTFLIPKDELAGLKYRTLEFILDITPKENEK